jgi:hypothetical protein
MGYSRNMKSKTIAILFLAAFAISGLSACKAKHCAALDDGMEGYSAKKNKKKKGRQEGLFGKRGRGF